MKEKIKEITDLLLQGEITKEESDKRLLDLIDTNEIACEHKSNKIWNTSLGRYCENCNKWLR